MNQFSRYLGGQPERGDQDVDFARLLGILIDNKWKILITTALFFAGGIVYASLSTPVYRGNALVQIEKRSSVSPLGDLDSILGGEPQNNASVEIDILRSRMVLGRVVDRMGLDTVVEPHRLLLIGGFIQRENIPRPDVENIPLLGSMLARYGERLPESLDIASAVWGGEHIQMGLFDVADRLRGQPLTLTVLDPEHYRLALGNTVLGTGRVNERAAFLDDAINLRIADIQAPSGAEFTLLKKSRAAAISELAGRLSVAESGGGSSGNVGMLRLTLTGTDSDEIRRSLDAICETFLMQNVERQSAQVDQRLAFLQEQAPDIRAQLSSAEDKLNQYRVQMDSVDLNTESQSVVTQLIDIEKKLSELEFQEAELVQRFTPNHPSYQALMRQKRYLLDERSSLEERIGEMPAAQQEIVRLTRDVQVTQAIYVNLLNRSQELQLAKAGTVGNVRIIDNTQVGNSPIAPKKSLSVMMSTLIGAGLAVMLVLLRAFLNRGIEDPAQLEELGLPVYAAIPLSDDQHKLGRRIKHRRDRKSSSVFHGILATLNPTDTAVEALRGLRTSLHFAMMESGNNRIMVTGPSPEIGKSFVTVNLGVVCAQAGKRVLIIDADMRKGHIHRAFGQPSNEGLSDLLSGRLEWKDAIRSTDLDGLFYISRGMVPPNPSELLMQDRFDHFLDGFGPEYDLVIIDTPPVLAVTDAAIVGKRVGTSLMLARYQLNPPSELNMAIRRLENAGVQVRGFILNAIEGSAVTYSYGYYNYAYK
ncbi:polysaccharide biosynthesis tyrosine autokinase [Halomonas organivorans]|uniref:Tyrosine-protein kinase Etk/Wzc n=1 Tax=Halomonas organivorans TaxID=257772 RepID=A0A7W5BVW1_9GAMM|nr:polysaccharide biosynthesis tyrosine autokinase [Halomonas organivorans]MBB3140071.1 tyrosine-protein kinase Etk/Wzc [Halomonas organivorans]